jgi:hypothetical protein
MRLRLRDSIFSETIWLAAALSSLKAEDGPCAEECMDSRTVLFLMTALAGFIMVVGGIWLIYKEKIYIDRESQKPIEIKLPGNFSFTSNYPALALFVLGFFPLMYPLNEVKIPKGYVKVTRVKLKGLAHSDAYPAMVYAAEVPYPVMKDGDGFDVTVPVFSNTDEYKMLLISNGHVLDYQSAPASSVDKDGQIIVNFKPVLVDPPAYAGQIAPVPAAYQ